MFCIRSTPNDVTGQTPFFRLYGREMNTKLAKLGVSPTKPVSSRTRDVAAEYSKRWSTVKHYTPGQRVLVRKQPGQPYMQEGVVVCAIADHTYEIKIGGAYRRYNQSHLKTLHDNLELGLEDIDANRAYDEGRRTGSAQCKDRTVDCYTKGIRKQATQNDKEIELYHFAT